MIATPTWRKKIIMSNKDKKFDIDTCEVNEDGQLVCEELPTQDIEDKNIVVAEDSRPDVGMIGKPNSDTGDVI